jgi:hypothetical protein
MARGATRTIVGAVVVLVVGTVMSCTLVRPTRAPDRPWRWEEPRSEYLRRSRVWLGGDVESQVRRLRSLDLRSGPPGRHAFPPEALVRCSYVRPPDGTPLGRTPKFLCRHAGAQGDEVLLIKWGADNGEVYAEVASSHLLWALGFPADRMYPVRVACEGCPEDPWRAGQPEPGSTRRFAPAVVKRSFPGRTIEEYADQGWSWEELGLVDPAVGGAPRAHLDALRLLAAFLQHRDSKPSNQRLVCPDRAVVDDDEDDDDEDLDDEDLDDEDLDDDDPLDCRHPVALVSDLGSTFGGPAWLFTHKMALDAWTEAPLWEDPRHCVARLTAELAATGGLEHAAIGEEGRRFLSTLLDALDDRQLRALFEVARGDSRGGVSKWVAAFKQRRDAVRRPVPAEPGFRCPAP